MASSLELVFNVLMSSYLHVILLFALFINSDACCAIPLYMSEACGKVSASPYTIHHDTVFSNEAVRLARVCAPVTSFSVRSGRPGLPDCVRLSTCTSVPTDVTVPQGAAVGPGQWWMSWPVVECYVSISICVAEETSVGCSPRCRNTYMSTC